MSPNDHAPSQLTKKYVIFFDVNLSKGIHEYLISLAEKADLIFLINERSVFNRQCILKELEDPPLLNYVLSFIDAFCPEAICFFFTTDGKILRDISINHPVRHRLYFECVKARSRKEFDLLAKEIIDRFENRIKK